MLGSWRPNNCLADIFSQYSVFYFCRFPAYFNFFVRKKKVVLIVDSEEAEKNIRSVFEETLLGPPIFRDEKDPLPFSEDDFDPSFPVERRPDLYKELKHFRMLGETLELSTDLLIEFRHFEGNSTESSFSAIEPLLGVPPNPPDHSESLDMDELKQSLHGSLSPLRASFQRNRVHIDDTLLTSSSTILSPNKVISTHGDEDSKDHKGVKCDESEKERRESGTSTVSHTMEQPFSCETPSGTWSYSRVKWLGQVSTVWPMDASPEDIKARKVPRVEIFRMPGGSEYYIHDIDANNVIIGKYRFSGTVRIPEKIAVEGFSPDLDCPSANSDHPVAPPPTFHPPSFGVTVLGNSHGFDKNGSTSGYVIWVNGRGIMVDPPPYSSATLEREGIRPQLIIGLIITHCHADHDAGAFQKVLTGSRVSVITAPSIYKSFIRKYAALSGLKPSILKHSHRFRPAIVGKPLHFQGASFEFNFSLHAIPCMSFKVSWRGRSIVFTGDHLNSPPVLEQILEKGVLSRGRWEELTQLPLQDCDVLLHEAGTPPIHTPLKVLQELPEEIKERLYVVHTSDLPPDCGLRIAPTGTAGTIRLDQTKNRIREGTTQSQEIALSERDLSKGTSMIQTCVDPKSFDDGENKNLTVLGDFMSPWFGEQQNGAKITGVPPLVFLRPTDVSDAWFILNLLSNVPFFSGLSYMNTMEVLEIASVKVFCVGDVVVPAFRRSQVLCVVWEGTCTEKIPDKGHVSDRPLDVWQAGDWAGPVSMAPDADDYDTLGRDIVAVSGEGVKAIMLMMDDLERILYRGSTQYRKFLALQQQYNEEKDLNNVSFGRIDETSQSWKGEHVLDNFKFNSVFNSLTALQKRSLEPIAEGSRVFQGGSLLWKVGDKCENGYLIVSGTLSFGSPGLQKNKASTPPPHVRQNSTVRSRRNSSTLGQIELSNGCLVEYDKVIPEVSGSSEFARLESLLTGRIYDEYDDRSSVGRGTRTTEDRFINRMLGRLYTARRYTASLVFSKGAFLCDTSRMVSGELVEQQESLEIGGSSSVHSSNLVVGPEGCVAFVFPKATFAPFLDAHPGLLLSLQGTQVVV